MVKVGGSGTCRKILCGGERCVVVCCLVCVIVVLKKKREAVTSIVFRFATKVFVFV